MSLQSALYTAKTLEEQFSYFKEAVKATFISVLNVEVEMKFNKKWYILIRILDKDNLIFTQIVQINEIYTDYDYVTLEAEAMSSWREFKIRRNGLNE